VTPPVLEPAGSADEYALQALERLQEVASTLIRAMTGKQMQRMKKYYDTSIKPQRFEEGENVLFCDTRKKRSHYVNWEVSWKGP